MTNCSNCSRFPRTVADSLHGVRRDAKREATRQFCRVGSGDVNRLVSGYRCRWQMHRRGERDENNTRHYSEIKPKKRQRRMNHPPIAGIRGSAANRCGRETNQQQTATVIAGLEPDPTRQDFSAAVLRSHVILGHCRSKRYASIAILMSDLPSVVILWSFASFIVLRCCTI